MSLDHFLQLRGLCDDLSTDTSESKTEPLASGDTLSGGELLLGAVRQVWSLLLRLAASSVIAWLGTQISQGPAGSERHRHSSGAFN